MSVNKIMLLGRLGKDPEVTDVGEYKVCKFSLATSSKYKKQETTTWHNIVAWGKTGEIIAEYHKKGDQIWIEGRVDNRTYEKDGVKKYISEVIVDKFSFVGSKQSDNGAGKTADDTNEIRW